MLAPGLAATPAVASAQPVVDDLARARELRLAGRAAEAAQLLERVVAARPNDADIWLELGLARAAGGSLVAADQALARAEALAPTYLDVQIARARIAYFRGDLAEARRQLARAAALAPDNPEVRELASQLSHAAAARWRLDAGYSQARLSRSLPVATEATASLTRMLPGGSALTAAVDQVRQFGRSDSFIELQAARPFGYLALGATPHANFRPQWSVRGGLSTHLRPLAGGWSGQLGLDAGWARYPVGDVRGLHPSLTLARGEQIALQARWINVLDERRRYRSGYALRGDWRAAPKLRLVAGWSSAPESDQAVTVNVRTVTSGVVLQAGEATTLRLDLAHEKRPSYDRDVVAVGIARRF